MKKRISLLLAVLMLAGLAPMAAIPASAADEPAPPSIPVESDTKDAATAATIYLSDESIVLPADYSVAAYSLDGGEKWKKGALPTGDKFKKLFNKELTLWLSSVWIDKAVKADPEKNIEAVAKGVPDNAPLIKFPKFNARPKKNADKLKPYYHDQDWVLAKKGETQAVFEGYEYAPSANGKTPTGDWEPMPPAGVPIISGKAKTTYLLRTVPSSAARTPGSASFKVKPANFGKAPSYKMTSKNDKDKNVVTTITLKKGDSYALETAPDVVGAFSPALAGKELLNVQELVAKGNNFLHVKKAATGKKPPSEVQKIDFSKIPLPPQKVRVTATSNMGSPGET
ncbi:MAG: hypothetical protein FWG42_04090, partial [Clostridiales bacterium]|nr:hypothetical protein [Clostridiales bacterium]